MNLRTGLKIINLLILSAISVFTVYSQDIKVGIVGYTLLNEFRVIPDINSKIYIDGVESKITEAIISKDGFINAPGIDTKFHELEITGGEETLFISDLGIQPYSGDFLITFNKHKLEIINTVSEYQYFSSVLGSELGDNYHTEALKAQLLAIKEFYKIRKKRNHSKRWDILNTSRVMSYRGKEYTTPKIQSVVIELQNISLHLPEDIEPMFFSTAAGFILKQECITSTFYSPPQNPVLIKEENTTSPHYNFLIDIEKSILEKALNSVTNISINKIELKYFENSDCVDYLILWDESGNRELLKGYKFISLIQRVYGSDFKSIQFKVSKSNSTFTFYGKGFGHFIGLSQYGAQEMASTGYNFEEILKHYYPGATIIY